MHAKQLTTSDKACLSILQAFGVKEDQKITKFMFEMDASTGKVTIAIEMWPNTSQINRGELNSIMKRYKLVEMEEE